MQAFSRFLVEKINRLALLKVKRIFAIEAGNLVDFVKIIKRKGPIGVGEAIATVNGEVAVKGGNQSVFVTKGINMDSDIKVETYLDNVKIENKNDENKKTDVKDDTMAPNEIPQTGVKSVIIIILEIGA